MCGYSGETNASLHTAAVATELYAAKSDWLCLIHTLLHLPKWHMIILLYKYNYILSVRGREGGREGEGGRERVGEEERERMTVRIRESGRGRGRGRDGPRDGQTKGGMDGRTDGRTDGRRDGRREDVCVYAHPLMILDHE